MRRIVCLLLAVVLTMGALAGISFAADPIAEVTNGSTVTKVYSNTEIAPLISEDGTTVVKMLRDDVIASGTYIYKVPSFTLDLNGHKVGTTGSSAIGVHKLGTKNTTTVVKNGTLVGGGGTSVALNVQVGGFRAENVTFTSESANTAVGIYQLKGDWNADNLITGCTLVGAGGAALSFTSTTDSQAAVSAKIENSVLLNTKLGSGNGTYPVNIRQVEGGSIVLGKNVHFFAADNLGWHHPDLKFSGEAVTYKGGEGAFKAPGLDLEFMNLHHWATDEGGLKNTTMEFIQNVKPEASTTTPTIAAPDAVQTFSDVAASFWGFDAINAAYEAGLVKGKSTAADGKMNYAPNDTMTRAEFLTTILRLFHTDEAAKAAAGAKWWSGYYDLAKAKGILKEGELENGDLDKAMTREEMALVIHRTAPSLKGYTDVKKAAVSSIPDFKTTTNAYKDAVLWVYGAGLIKGMDESGAFAPQGSLTRAQSATVLAKLVRMKNASVDIVLPTVTVEETLENRQKAIVETAMAYHGRGTAMQYDSLKISADGASYGWRGAANPARNAPEYASTDMTLHSVCSLFAWQVSQRVLGYRLLNDPNSCITTNLAAVTEQELGAAFVYQYENTGDAAKDDAAMKTAVSLMQPGDVVTYTRGPNFASGGHTVIYTYDVTGDGKDDVVHCSDRDGGGKYSIDSGIDKKEIHGGIILNQSYAGNGTGQGFFNEVASGSSYLPTTARYSIIRPAALDAKTYPISEETKTRITFPRLAITYQTDTGFYGAAVKGQYLTYTLTLANKSKQDHKGIKVQIPTLSNATLCMVDGKEFKENLAVLTVDVPAGSEVKHTFTFRVMGDVGEHIISTGYVHTIKLPEMKIGIVSHMPTKEQFWDTAVQEAATKAANNTDAFAEAYYEAATGKDVDFPTMEEVLKAGFTQKTNKMYVPIETPTDPVSKMFVRDYFGGYGVREPNEEARRVVEVRAQDALPGDALYILRDKNDLSTAEVWVYDGSLYRGLKDGNLVPKPSAEVTKLLSADVFILLRASQMG